MRFLINLKNLIWIWWSNYHYKKIGAELHSTAIDPSDTARTMNSLLFLMNKLYDKFHYTKDGADLLYDAMIPPCEAYKQYRNGELKDDCDGFHSLVYHCLKFSGFEAYLLTANSIKSGHCVVIFRMDYFWHVVDYNSIYTSTRTLETSLGEFNDYYSKKYCNGQKVLCNNLYSYDYKQGKFIMHNTKKMLEEN